MSHIVVEDRPTTLDVAAPVRPGFVERRRPGRMETATPELIALMRKPTRAARLRVALYDAPGFIVPVQHRRPPVTRHTVRQMAIAAVTCSVLCGGAFEMMLLAWG